jgi:16S rRNA (cytidine1402-2'-O)-methyltransferase
MCNLGASFGRLAWQHGVVAGTLTLAATPIGRVDDASPRLAAALERVDVIAAEDTRRLRRLAGELGVAVSGRVVSYYEGNEERRTVELVEALRGGADVLLVTDAGMPSVSDPGYRLVAAAAATGLPISVLPGPSAVLAALAVSGLPVDRFCFEGFLPRKSSERRRRLAELVTEPRTMVFFEAPRRTAAALAAMAEAWGPDRRAAVCRELTKTHEEVRRGTLGELATWAEGGVLGEVTLVVAGADPSAAPTLSESELVARVHALEADGMSRRDAIATVARETGVRRREVYDAVHRA